MKPVTRTIVIGHATAEGGTHSWPVAVFGNQVNARHHANYTTMATRAGDADLLKRLDPDAMKTKDGKVIKTAWYTQHTVPYDPEIDLGDSSPLTA